MSRYQECNKLEKLWRCRWYIIVPFKATWYYISKTKIYEDKIENGKVKPTGKFDIMPWKLCWSVATGNIHYKMKYYYTAEEAFSSIEKKLNKTTI